MLFTTFTCGVFYERFARGGLASKGIGLGTGLEQQGAYLLDIERNTGEVIEHNAAGQPVYLCLTSVVDVARFVVEAIGLGISTWPAEFRMRGDRRTVTQIIEYAEAIKRSEFELLSPSATMESAIIIRLIRTCYVNTALTSLQLNSQSWCTTRTN